jgi:hypothetical protein
MNYFDSTQNQNWIYSIESLDKQNLLKFEKGLMMMREIYKTDAKINKKSKY